MANFKNIISGAFNKVADKVQEVKENGSIRELYEQGTDKVKSYGRIAKLNIELSGHREELKRMYTEIGKQYYEQAKGCPEGFFTSLFAQVEDLLEEVSEKEAEIAALKEGSVETCSGIDVEIVEDDFEPVVDGSCCTCTCDGETCTCTCDGETCTCTCNGETCTCTCDGETCTCTCDGETCTCTCDGETCTCTCDDNCCKESVCDKVEDFVEKVCDKAECVCDKIEEMIECVCDKVEEKIDEKPGE